MRDVEEPPPTLGGQGHDAPTWPDVRTLATWAWVVVCGGITAAAIVRLWAGCGL